MSLIDRVRELEEELANINRRLTGIRGQGAAATSLAGLNDVNIPAPARHDFLMYDPITSRWISFEMDMDFEDSIDYEVSNMWEALTALIRIEDSLDGEGLIIEDEL